MVCDRRIGRERSKISWKNEIRVGIFKWCYDCVSNELKLTLSKNIFFFSLNPKCYFAIDYESKEFKRSQKGVQHRVQSNYDQYKAAVYKSKTEDIDNTVIRLRNNEMNTIICKKVGLQNVFVKGFVEEDFITVRPFKRFICPEN